MQAILSMDVITLLPLVMLDYARKAHLAVMNGYSTRYEPLQALLLTATAGEAAVNFMLEPLLGTTDWQAIERWGQERKWTRLSKELGLTPKLEKTEKPLRGFLATLEARHHVVHFQRGKNVQRMESPPFPVASGMPMSEMRVVGPPAAAEDVLRPENAVTYYPSLEKLLRAVLPAYRKREDGLGLYFELALDGKVTEQQDIAP